MRIMSPIAVGFLYAAGVLRAASANAADAPAPAPAPSKPHAASQWSHSGRAGAFVTNVYTEGAGSSRDPAIGGARESTAFLLTLDAALLWRGGPESSEQNLRLRYGRVRVEGVDWIENQDEAHYDGVVRYSFAKPHFVYGAWGTDSVFTSPVDHQAFDPVTARVSAGYGQLYEGLLLQADHEAKDHAGEDRLEVRLGVRAQKRWSRHDTAFQDRIEVGPEGYARYDRPIDPSIRFFAQYEVFSEFDDIKHVTQLVTAGLTAALGTYVTLELAFRAYFESHPHEAPAGSTGYDSWSVRQDTLIGLTYSF